MIEKSDQLRLLRLRQALKTTIDNSTFRWLLCHDCSHPSEYPDDCGCCISWNDDNKCGCLCHERINELDRLFYACLKTLLQEGLI